MYKRLKYCMQHLREVEQKQKKNKYLKFTQSCNDPDISNDEMNQF